MSLSASVASMSDAITALRAHQMRPGTGSEDPEQMFLAGFLAAMASERAFWRTAQPAAPPEHTPCGAPVTRCYQRGHLLYMEF